MIFYVEDIGTDEVILAGKYHPATRFDPAETDEVYDTIAGCLDVKNVFMVQNKDRFHYVTDEDTKMLVWIETPGSNGTSSYSSYFNLFNIVKRLENGTKVSNEEAAAVMSWLEEQSFSCENDLRDWIAEKGQENYRADREIEEEHDSHFGY